MENVKKFLDGFKNQDMEQNQNEAIIELLVWTMYVDKSIMLIEDEKISQYIDKTNWKSGITSEDFLKSAIARVRNAVANPAKASELIASISKRLDCPDVKNKALKACKALAEADGKLSDEEKKFIDTLKKALSVR
ncbi:MAG: TerB family tellurite resistance protein [Victivallales bacterium]